MCGIVGYLNRTDEAGAPVGCTILGMLNALVAAVLTPPGWLFSVSHRRLLRGSREAGGRG